MKTKYDIVILGAGHNGLISACYLAKAGLSVLILEKNSELGGATRSKAVFNGFDANLSVYSYLISLLPEKIIRDLDLGIQLKKRTVSSWTPAKRSGKNLGLLIRNSDEAANEAAFASFTGGTDDYKGYSTLQQMQAELAETVWPSLTKPLASRDEMRSGLHSNGRQAWDALIEEPIGNVIEKLISDNFVRGLVFTDGRIGLSTLPHDSSLLQNKCFLYHVIGQGTGDWCVPVGGMGTLVNSLIKTARDTGKVEFATGVDVQKIHPDDSNCEIQITNSGKDFSISTRYLISNASEQVLHSLIDPESDLNNDRLPEGAGFKINMLLKRLPRLASHTCSPEEAFSGTFHIDEGYEEMQASCRESLSGKIPEKPPGEIYCHTLTDNSILSKDLNERGFHTLTLFGLDMPYRLFLEDNENARVEAVQRYMSGINQYLDEPLEDCLAEDANGRPCVEAMSPLDLEQKIHLPKGNIFHGDLTWPFTDSENEVGQWGVETKYSNVFLGGSSAKRGGAVSGIPGHNAAMKILELLGISPTA